MTALPEIAYNDYITSAAISYSEYLSTNNAMEHNANGTPKSRLAAKGYSYYAGEILAFGNSDDYNTTVNSESASINFIRDIIIDSQSFDINRRNLVLSPDVKKTGIGYKNNPASTYKNIIVVVFGSY